MRRDNFKCCICGASPALNAGTILVVDHVIPWTGGGETVMENLQTLCQPCNGGKSNLPMEAEQPGTTNGPA
jgi:5-methylcytosine-specific restriction endonuclease McrA